MYEELHRCFFLRSDDLQLGLIYLQNRIAYKMHLKWIYYF